MPKGLDASSKNLESHLLVHNTGILQLQCLIMYIILDIHITYK